MQTCIQVRKSPHGNDDPQRGFGLQSDDNVTYRDLYSMARSNLGDSETYVHTDRTEVLP